MPAWSASGESPLLGLQIHGFLAVYSSWPSLVHARGQISLSFLIRPTILVD